MSPAPTEAFLAALERREPIDQPVAVVVAHPDDETIGAGPLLRLFRELLLVHVTDGAPRSLHDASAAGFGSCQAYAQARTAELRNALRAGSVTARCVALGVPDQQTSHQLAELGSTLRSLLAGCALVMTHAYEGGHPDHDAVAFAVHAAGRPVAEMAGYHASPAGGIAIGCFLPGEVPETVVALTGPEQEVRSRMLHCFATQQATLTPFGGTTALRFRAAPAYDFTQPPASRVYYDDFPWGMTSGRWCALAAEALR